jgi:hypothetical protein
MILLVLIYKQTKTKPLAGRSFVEIKINQNNPFLQRANMGLIHYHIVFD